MNADEIVRALREWDELYLADACVDVPMGCEKYCKDKDCIVVQAVYLIESLQAQLAASQARERAAQIWPNCCPRGRSLCEVKFGGCPQMTERGPEDGKGERDGPKK